MRTIYIATGNPLKLKRAQNALSRQNIAAKQIHIETPEIQSEDVEEIVQYSAQYAAEIAKKPIIKNDQGLIIPSLGGFPGPFAKYINKWLSVEQFVRLYNNETDKSGYWLDTLCYAEPEHDPVVFSARIMGTMINEPRGRGKYMLDTVFEVDSIGQTIAELTKEEYFDLWSTDIYSRLAQYLKE